jgi:WXG100 family type VII secretion target
MVRLSAETEDIHAKATAVQQQASEIDAQLSQLTAAITDLQATWQGPASTAFHGLYDKWRAQATNMSQMLESIGQALNTVGSDYEQLETQIASQLQ